MSKAIVMLIVIYQIVVVIFKLANVVEWGWWLVMIPALVLYKFLRIYDNNRNANLVQH